MLVSPGSICDVVHSSATIFTCDDVDELSVTFTSLMALSATNVLLYITTSLTSTSFGLLHRTGCGLSIAGHITGGTCYCSCVCSGEKGKAFNSHNTVSLYLQQHCVT